MIKLGCFSHCDEIILKDELGVDITANSDGIYQFKAKFNNRLIDRQIEFEQGDVLKIPASNFNEDSYFMLKVTDSTGLIVGIFIFSVYVRI